MRKFLFYSSFFVISLLVVTHKVLSSPNKLGAKKINYGFVITTEALAKPSTTTDEVDYITGYCVEFLNNLKNDVDLKSQYSFFSHAIQNQGKRVKGLMRGTFDGLKNGKLDIHCGAMTPHTDVNENEYKKAGLVFSDPFFMSEVKILTINNSSNEFLKIEDLSGVGNIFNNKRYTVGVLMGHEHTKDILIMNNFNSNDVKIIEKNEDLQSLLEKYKIKGIAYDTLHMKSYIDLTRSSSPIIRENKYIILPPPRSSDGVRKTELVTYRFAFNNSKNRIIKDDLIDANLRKASYKDLSLVLDNFKKEINNLSQTKLKPLPTSQLFLDNILNYLRLIFQSKFFKNNFIILLLLACIFFVLPPGYKSKIIDVISEELSKFLEAKIKSWAKSIL